MVESVPNLWNFDANFLNFNRCIVFALGRWLKNKFGEKDNEEEELEARRRRKRNIASVSYPPSYKDVLLHRRKRFVGQFVCEVLAPQACKGSKFLCKGLYTCISDATDYNFLV